MGRGLAREGKVGVVCLGVGGAGGKWLDRGGTLSGNWEGTNGEWTELG